MRDTRRSVVAILLIAIALLLTLRWAPTHEQSQDLRTPQTLATETIAMPAAVAAASKPRTRLRLHRPPAQVVPAGFMDLVLRLDRPEDWEEVVRDVRDRGGEILGHLEALGRLQVRIPHHERSGLLRATSRAIEEDNVPIFAPVPVSRDDEAGAAQAPFGRGALAWLGLPDDAPTGEGVTIAVLDTALSDHEVLENAEVDRLSVDEQLAMDGEYAGHGNAVAGLLVGDGELLGMVPDARLLGIQVLNGEGAGTAFSLAMGIVEAVERGADIINMSLGTYTDSPVLREAVAYALEAGVLLVGAAGNDQAAQPLYPARYDGVLSVTAVDAAEDHVSFANTGEIDLAAPGYGVVSAWDEGLVYLNGTSIAASLVTGALAVMMSGDREASAAREEILAYSDDVGRPGEDDQFGQGILNMERALIGDEPGMHDLAIGGITSEAGLQVTVQNRGTEPVVRGKVLIESEAGEQRETIVWLAAGESVGVTVSPVPKGGLVSAQATLDAQDERPKNDNRQLVLERIDGQ